MSESNPGEFLQEAAVTIVMCTWNGGPYLRAQLDSLLAQTHPVEALLVFDDGSTDNTMEILLAYSNKFPKLSVHRNETRLGFNSNFEKALRAAQTPVIAIADQDDVWHPQKIQRMVAAWNPASPVIYCASFKFRGEVPADPQVDRRVNVFSGTTARKLFFGNTVSGHAMLLQRDFLDMILPFREGIYYDWWTAFVAACNGGVDYLDEALVYHRIHGGNASYFQSETRREDVCYRRSELAKHLPILLQAPGIDDRTKKIGEAFYEGFTQRETTLQKWKLFFLILRYRWSFFYTKKRKPSSLISHLKHAYMWSFY